MMLTEVMFREITAADLHLRCSTERSAVAAEIGTRSDGLLSLYFDDADQARAFFNAGLEQLDALEQAWAGRCSACGAEVPA